MQFNVIHVDGSGKIRKTKRKMVTPFAKPSKCSECEGARISFLDLQVE